LRETAQAAGAFDYVLKENLFTLSRMLREQKSDQRSAAN
jgi:hypothetical protein